MLKIIKESCCAPTEPPQFLLLSVRFWRFRNVESCWFKMCLFLRAARARKKFVDVQVWITKCGTCLVMLKHPSYTSSVFLHRQPKKQDVNAWRNACSPSQSWAPGIGTRGKRVRGELFSRQFPFFSFFPPPGNRLIITSRPEQVSDWVWGWEEWLERMVVSKGRRAAAVAGMQWGLVRRWLGPAQSWLGVKAQMLLLRWTACETLNHFSCVHSCFCKSPSFHISHL